MNFILSNISSKYSERDSSVSSHSFSKLNSECWEPASEKFSFKPCKTTVCRRFALIVEFSKIDEHKYNDSLNEGAANELIVLILKLCWHEDDEYGMEHGIDVERFSDTTALGRSILKIK